MSDKITSASPPFAAVLLAGGKSRRMGRDKAMLPLPDGRLLWQRQLDILRGLDPSELFISGSARPGFPDDIKLLADEKPDLGPLSGIAAALSAMTSPLLVVLAIDMPAMTTGFLHRLLVRSRPHFGMVPQHRHGTASFHEPLAAIYPRDCLPVAWEHLERRELTLQGFVRAAAPWLQTHPIATDEGVLFANWNEEATGIGPAA